MAEVDADHAAVGDDQHVVAVPMAGADPLDGAPHPGRDLRERFATGRRAIERRADPRVVRVPVEGRSEEHTSELQTQSNLVCRLLLEKKKSPARSSATRSRRSTCRSPAPARTA